VAKRKKKLLLLKLLLLKHPLLKLLLLLKLLPLRKPLPLLRLLPLLKLLPQLRKLLLQKPSNSLLLERQKAGFAGFLFLWRMVFTYTIWRQLNPSACVATPTHSLAQVIA